MKTFEEYDSLVTEMGKPDKETPKADLVQYVALKLNGEAGEVAELVGKSMRSYSRQYADGGELDPVKVVLELGDVLWYVARMASLMGATLGDVAEVNREKHFWRREFGKEPVRERARAELTLKICQDGRAAAKRYAAPPTPAAPPAELTEREATAKGANCCAWCLCPLAGYLRLPGGVCSMYCRAKIA